MIHPSAWTEHVRLDLKESPSLCYRNCVALCEQVHTDEADAEIKRKNAEPRLEPETPPPTPEIEDYAINFGALTQMAKRQLNHG